MYMKNKKAGNCLGMGVSTRGGGRPSEQPNRLVAMWLRNLKSASAFTMAEILLSLTIIGVVAAITLPSLTGNINERTWNTQRKALYARFSQALALMPNLNGYGTLHAAGTDASGSSFDAEDDAAMAFLTDGLTKVLKTTNLCDADALADCGIPDTITAMNGDVISNFNTSPYNTLVGFNSMFNGTWNDGTSGATNYTYEQLDTKAAAFETANGESILVYYNPNCVSDMNETGWHYTQPKMCANFVYDLNGSKGPNTVGKDIGVMSVIYPSDSVVVMPVPVHILSGSYEHQQGAKECSNNDSESRLPNIEELLGIYYNGHLLGWGDNAVTGKFWSATVTDSAHAYAFGYSMGLKYERPKTETNNVQCVKR